MKCTHGSVAVALIVMKLKAAKTERRRSFMIAREEIA